MKKNSQISNKSEEALIISIAPENWQVTDPTNIKICQQPAKILPWPLLPVIRLPRYDVWQLDELFSGPNQQHF